MKELFSVYSEFDMFRLYELEDEYRGILTSYLFGEVSDEVYYSYPKTNVPEDLLVLLIEADPNNLTYEQETMLWNLVDDEYEI